MGKKSILRAAMIGALVLPSQAWAQEEGGVVTTFSIDQRLSAGRNLALETPAEGHTYASDTQLSFGVTSTTPLDRLSATGSVTLRLADEPTETVTEFERPRLDFLYTREGANAAFELGGNYRRDRVDFLRDLSSFLDEEGNLDLPEDFEDFTGEGTRADYGLNATLELGTTAPFGLTLEAGLNGRDYQDTTSATLTDLQRIELGATGRFTFSPVSEGRLSLDHSVSDEEDAAQTQVTTQSVEASLAQEVSPRSRFEAGLGYTIAETEEFGAVTDEEKGLTGRFGYEWDMPDGQVDAALETTRNDNGARTELSFGRTRDLPLGRLTARLGVSKADFGDPELIGRVAWNRLLPTGGISASLDHAVRSTGTNAEAQTTTLALNWNRDINDLSGISLGVNYLTTSETGENDISRTSLSASYRHDLTEDWAMRLGLTWRMRDEQNVGSSTSEEVFLSIGRDFSWRR